MIFTMNNNLTYERICNYFYLYFDQWWIILRS